MEDIHGPVEQPADGKLIGSVLPNGERVTNYHLNPGRTISVDLVRSCNMSFRRDVIRELGGFDPAAKVIHLSAVREDIPRKLSDLRAQFYKARNWTLWVGKNLTWNRDYIRHLWLRQTAAIFHMEDIAFGRKVLLAGANIFGKIAGTFVWGRWRLGGKKKPALKWQDQS